MNGLSAGATGRPLNIRIDSGKERRITVPCGRNAAVRRRVSPFGSQNAGDKSTGNIY